MPNLNSIDNFLAQFDSLYHFVCAIETYGTFKCCGEGYENVAPSKVGTVSSFIDLEGSIRLIKIDGTAQCWGKDGAGQSSVPADFQ